MTEHRKFDGTDEAELLAPWFATGKLSAAEEDLVSAALSKDEDFAAHMALVDEERLSEITASESIKGPSRASFNALMTEIDALPAPRRALLPRLSAMLGSFGLSGKPAMAAFAAMLLVIAVQSGVFTSKEGPGFSTATAPAVTQYDGVLLVGFAPESPVGEITELLVSLDGAVISGPTSGLFRIGFETEEVAAQALAAFQGRGDLVIFAAPGE